MRRIILIVIGMLIFSLLAGCKVPQKVTDDFKKAAALKEKSRKAKPIQQGYLSKSGVKKQTTPLKISDEDEEEKPESFDKYERLNLSKSELKKLLRENDRLYLQERKNSENLREDMLEEKRMFQKMLFSYATRLDNERKINQELKGNLIKAEMKAVQAEQKFREVQMNIMTRMNLFYAGYPFYYEVKKGIVFGELREKRKFMITPTSGLKFIMPIRKK